MKKNITSRYLIAAYFLIFFQACIEKQQKPPHDALPPAVTDTAAVKAKVPEPIQHTLVQFVSYEDDGDYFQFIALKGDTLISLINSDVSDRNLNRGDVIQVSWKMGTITVAGDGDTEMPAKILISVDKVRDGVVSKFRKSYAKKLKYTLTPDQNYSNGYKDKIYLIVEYYLATTQNKLLTHFIKKQEQLSYSIEEQSRHNRAYTMIGIGGGEQQSSPVQWLYIDNENYQLYEYDLANDELIPYR